jgi:hypothetical protein
MTAAQVWQFLKLQARILGWTLVEWGILMTIAWTFASLINVGIEKIAVVLLWAYIFNKRSESMKQ